MLMGFVSSCYYDTKHFGRLKTNIRYPIPRNSTKKEFCVYCVKKMETSLPKLQLPIYVEFVRAEVSSTCKVTCNNPLIRIGLLRPVHGASSQVAPIRPIYSPR